MKRPRQLRSRLSALPCLRDLPIAALTALICGSSLAEQVNDLPGGPAVNGLNLQPPATNIASTVLSLHWMMLIICFIIFVGVFGVMFYSIWKHRKSRGAQAANFHESTAVEIAWTVVPFLIVIAMAVPASKAVVEMKDTSSPDLTIKVTGYQWRWGYDYLRGEGEGLHFISSLATTHDQITGTKPRGDKYLLEVDNPLVVPVDKKIRLITTAADVIHSWWVPALAVKQDAFPGFVRDTWFRATKVGDYYGDCTELCGKNHAYMPVHVKVLSQSDYSAWAQSETKKLAAAADDPSKTYTLEELTTRGEKVYAANCVVCHQTNGKGSGTVLPLDASPAVLGPKAAQITTVLEGRKNGAMPAWKASLNDVEIAAVITYTRHAWSNQGKGQDAVVQPADVTAAHGAK